MAAEQTPFLQLLLKPKAQDAENVVGLHFSLSIHGVPLKAGDLVCTYGRRAEVHVSQLQDYFQSIHDDEGPVSFDLSGSGEEKAVRVTREVIGTIAMSSNVQALARLDVESYNGDAAALRLDDGGILGAGRFFLPRFHLRKCQMRIEWDLSGCPAGTRAVSSFGEGAEPIEVSGHSDILLDCVFMVGVGVQSFPPAESSLNQTGSAATYWFQGSTGLPRNWDAVKDYTTKILPRMAEHFEDKGGTYRAFLRRAPPNSGLKGTAFGHSGIIDYDEDTKDEQDWDLVRVLNRTMVSAWARLDPEDDGSENDWYTQGLSYLFSVFLPFRFGQRRPDYFRATVNGFLSSYFTNPLVSKPLSELTALDPSRDWYVASARATRAFLYMLKMDFGCRRAAKARGVDLERPMDDLVRDLCSRRKRGEKVQRKEWQQGIAFWRGEDDADKLFSEMLLEGKVNELDDMLSSFGTTYGPRAIEQEVLDFGFDRESLAVGLVSGLVEGSRASGAGLRNGDVILWHSRPEIFQIHYEEKFKVVVERDKEKLDIEYWPRSGEKVVCWQVLERLKPETEAT